MPAREVIGYFTHGTTVGINTVIQRKGIRLCLFTTENFDDVLELARLKMPDPYTSVRAAPTPLVTARPRAAGMRERMLADGTVDTPLDEASAAPARRAGARARRRGHRHGAASTPIATRRTSAGRGDDRRVGAGAARCSARATCGR